MDKTKNKKSQTAAACIILCFFAAFNVFFFTPLDIFFANAKDIAFPLRSLMIFMGSVTLSVFAVLLAVCLLVKGKAKNIVRAVIFGVSMAFYIQGNFLALNMGELNGSRYELQFGKVLLSAAVWLVILAAPFFILKKFPDIFENVTSYIPAAIALIQAITLVISASINLATKYDGDTITEVFEADTRYTCVVKDLDVYGKNKNLIVILADTYGSFSFDSAIKEAPESVSEFDGFTYYTNTVGKFHVTNLGVAHIMTRSLDAKYTNTKLFDTLSENYKTYYYFDAIIPPASVIAPYSETMVSKTVSLSDVAGYSGGVYNIAFFRCMPEPLKPLFRSSGNIKNDLDAQLMKNVEVNGIPQYGSANLDFYETMPHELKTVDEDIFKYIYLYGLHSPCKDTADLQHSETEVSYTEEAVAVNKIINEYLKTLKENGIYDSCDIIVMADHGTQDEYNMYPLLMYKPAHQTETGIKVSNAPISYDDVYPTLLKLAGGEPQERTIFDIAEDEERVRHFEHTGTDVTGNIKAVDS